jgi:hypothetical protein
MCLYRVFTLSLSVMMSIPPEYPSRENYCDSFTALPSRTPASPTDAKAEHRWAFEHRITEKSSESGSNLHSALKLSPAYYAEVPCPDNPESDAGFNWNAADPPAGTSISVASVQQAAQQTHDIQTGFNTLLDQAQATISQIKHAAPASSGNDALHTLEQQFQQLKALQSELGNFTLQTQEKMSRELVEATLRGTSSHSIQNMIADHDTLISGQDKLLEHNTAKLKDIEATIKIFRNDVHFYAIMSAHYP